MNPVFREIVVGGECHLSGKPTLLSSDEKRVGAVVFNEVLPIGY